MEQIQEKKLEMESVDFKIMVLIALHVITSFFGVWSVLDAAVCFVKDLDTDPWIFFSFLICWACVAWAWETFDLKG